MNSIESYFPEEQPEKTEQPVRLTIRTPDEILGMLRHPLEVFEDDSPTIMSVKVFRISNQDSIEDGEGTEVGYCAKLGVPGRCGAFSNMKYIRVMTRIGTSRINATLR